VRNEDEMGHKYWAKANNNNNTLMRINCHLIQVGNIREVGMYEMDIG